MTTTATRPAAGAPNRLAKLSPRFAPSVEHLFPEHVEAPKPVKDAATRARKTLEPLLAIENEIAETDQALKRAPELDQAAVDQAVSVGATHPEPSEPKLKVKLGELRARQHSLRKIATQAFVEQAAALTDHYADTVEPIAAQRDAKLDRAGELLQELAATLADADDVEVTSRALAQFNGAAQNFVVEQPSSPERRARRHERALATNRAKLQANRNAPVERETDHLIAALELVLEARR